MPKLFKSFSQYPCCQRFAIARISRRVMCLPLWKTPKVRQPL